MKYTKNIGNQLLNLGFKFEANYTDDNINYDIYNVPYLEVKVDHTNKQVSTMIFIEKDDINVSSLGQLQDLKLMIKKITRPSRRKIQLHDFGFHPIEKPVRGKSLKDIPNFN